MSAADLYLSLLMNNLTNMLEVKARGDKGDYHARYEGHDWPSNAETMIGMRRLINIKEIMEEILRSDIPGDVIETGVWKGGATILMRAILKVYGDTTRKVWVADSFEGLPEPDPTKYPADAGDLHYTQGQLAVSLEQVKSNFMKYGLYDNQVRFLKGWFEDTLPKAPIEKLSLIRLDGDMYSSTIQALDALYSKLSHGGYVIVDDWTAVQGCRQAVLDFMRTHNINEQVHAIGGEGSAGSAFWRKH